MSVSWHDAPLVRLIIPLLLGCTVGNYMYRFPADSLYILTPVLILIALFFARKNRWKYPNQYTAFGVLIYTSFFFLGVYLTASNKEASEAEVQIHESADYHQATISKRPEIGSNSVNGELLITAYADNGEIAAYEQSRKAICYVPLDSGFENLEIGEEIIFSDHVQMPEAPLNPGQFNYAGYLAQSGFSGTVYLGSGYTTVDADPRRSRTLLFLRKLQNNASLLFEKYGMDPRELGIASALVLGNKGFLERDLKSQYADAGVVHILAVSGLHVGIIYLFLSFALNLVFRKRLPGVKLALILIFLWLYAGITGLSPSVLRAATMFSFVALGSLSKKKSNTYNMLAASAILLIIIDPGIVFQVGFQLSYLAVIGIVFTFPRIYPLLVFNSIVLDKIWSLVVVSIGAQLATFPLSLYYFHQFPLVFLITNLIVIPLATLALYSGLFYLIFNWVLGVDWILYKVFNGTLWAMNSFIEIVSQVPYAVLRDIPFTVGEMLLAYIFMIGATLAFYTPRRDYIRTTLFALLAMVSISSARLIANATRWEFTILEGRNSPVVCIQKGNSLTVLSVEKSKLDFDADNSFYLEGFYRKQGIHEVLYIPFSGNYKDAFLHVNDGILIVPNQVIQLTAQSENSSLAENCFGDVSIIHRRENLKRIAHCGEQTTLLMGREIPKWKRRDIFELVDREKVAIWDMNVDGIYRRKAP